MVESEPGQGSTFAVAVPRVHNIARFPEAARDWSLEPGKVPVLVVEDDAADAHGIERLLAHSVYQPLVAQTVSDAMKVMQKVKPEAILLDILLQGDETWRLMVQVRHDEPSADIPMIAISSSGEDRKALHLGADEYLAKPVDGDRLIDALDRVTGRSSLTKVLLVDDEEVTHYLVRQLLPRGRYRLSIASDGRAGFDMLVAQKPDVVLLDLRMPGMDGYTFLDHMQADPSVADVPAIVLTSSVLGSADRERLQQAACVLSKSELSSAILIDFIADAQRSPEVIDAR